MYPQLQAGATQSLPQSCSATVSGSAWAVGHRRFAPLPAVQHLLSVGIPWGWSSTANRAHHANGIVQPQWLLSLMMQRQSRCCSLDRLEGCGLGHVVTACAVRGLCADLAAQCLHPAAFRADEFGWVGRLGEATALPQGGQSPTAACSSSCTCDLWHKVSSKEAGTAQPAFGIRERG